MNIADKYYDDIKAETLLSSLYPEKSNWIVVHDGYFFRNYFNDLKCCDADSDVVNTSRNGIFQVLPEELFFSGNELEKVADEDYDSIDDSLQLRRKLIMSFFLPFDSLFFDYSLQLEKIANNMISRKIDDLLLKYFDYDISKENNRFIKLLAPMILQASKIRADFQLIAELLSAVTDCRVDYSIKGLAVFNYIFHRKDLDSRGYFELTEKIAELMSFVLEWFMPLEASCQFKVKDYTKRFCLSSDKPLLLDYNTQLLKNK